MSRLLRMLAAWDLYDYSACAHVRRLGSVRLQLLHNISLRELSELDDLYDLYDLDGDL